MHRYVFRMLADGWRLWTPAIGVVAVMATMIGLCVYQFAWTATSQFGDAAVEADVPLAEFQILSVTVYTLVALVSWVALTVVGQASVHATRHVYALWLLVGASPRTVFWSTLRLLFLVSLCGAVVGAAAATGLSFWAVPAFNSAVSSAVELPRFTPAPWAPVVIVVVSALTTLVGGVVPARRSCRVDPSVALRISDDRVGSARSAIIRKLSGALFFVVAVALVVASKLDTQLVAGGPGVVFNLAIDAGGSALIAVYLLCPQIVGAMFQMLHRLGEATGLVVSALGIRAAAARAQMNATTIAPLAVGLGGIGLLLCTVRSVGAFIDLVEPGVPANLSDVLVVVAVIAVSMLATSAAVVSLSARGREREIALLRVAGLRERQVVMLIAAESFAMAFAASAAACIPVIFGGLVCAFVSATSPVGTSVVVWPFGIMALGFFASWVVMFIILAVPAVAPLRDGPRDPNKIQ